MKFKTNRSPRFFYMSIAGLALLAMGATYSVRTMLEIGPTATITGSFPELQFLDTTVGDSDFEIEANGDRLQIGVDGGSEESVRIFADATEDSLIVQRGGVGVSDPADGVSNFGLTVGDAVVFLDSDDVDQSDWFITGGDVFALGDLDAPAIPFTIRSGPNSGGFIMTEAGDILMAPTDGSNLNLPVNSMGFAEPDAGLHVFRNDGSTGLTGIKVEDASSSTVQRNLLELANNGGVRFALDNLDINERWTFSNNRVGDFNVNRVGTGGAEMRVTQEGQFTTGPGGFAALDSRPNGNLFIAGSLFESSDREKKENFEEVDCEAILKQISEMPITTWNYKSDQQDIRHMGPVAQDFRSAFSLGDSDKTIATTDKVGVSLAAIKALNTKLQKKDNEIDALKLELDGMNGRMKKLEALLQKVSSAP